MGALEDYEDLYLPEIQDGGALSSLAQPPAASSTLDAQGRKDIFNQAAQRLLQARQAITQPYAGHNLGNEAFYNGLMGSGASLGDILANANRASTTAEEQQRQAMQQYNQQQQAADVQAQMAQILGQGGTIEDAATLGAIGGNDKASDNLSKIDIAKKTLEQGKYLPIKDSFGNVTGVLNTKTGKMVNMNGQSSANMDAPSTDAEPSSNPQIAAKQILDEAGTPQTPMTTRQDVIGRNAQAKAYRDAAIAAKGLKQQLDVLHAQEGKYWSGSMAGGLNSAEAAMNIDPFGGAAARAEADKASKALANAFMQANVGAKGAGIRMVEFDAGAVPNPNMPAEARTNLIKVNKAIADSQIQRAAISDMYPRMHVSNVNAIMDTYETANPPVLPNGEANPKWMTYKEWLKSGRPNTAQMALESKGEAPTDGNGSDSGASNILSAPPPASNRIKGQVYATPKGNMTWMGDHWTPAGGQ